jgi:hypothetical protein
VITRPQDDPRRAPGLRADLLLVDLLLVDGDPCADITATRTRTAIWRNGARLHREPHAPRRATRSHPPRQRLTQPEPALSGT